MSARIPEPLVELFESGVSILVGTCDAAKTPETTRGVGARVHPDRSKLTLFVPIEPSARTLRNLEETKRVAIGFSRLTDHNTIQVKGIVEESRLASDEERLIVERWVVAFSEILFITGIPRSLTAMIKALPAQAVTIRVTDLFQQTPGPNAGERLKQAAT